MDYSRNKEILREFYSKNGIIGHFEKDNQYLESAFHEITEMWFRNLQQIKEVRYLMIAEAPLWGKDKSYIYNPDTKNTQFFHKSDLEYVLNIQIADKQDFINCCNDIGLLIIDISPFALNPAYTKINYRTISKGQYRELVKATIPAFFEEKIKIVKGRTSGDIKVFFRYARVKKRFQDIISEVLINNNILQSEDEIADISKRGGGIEKVKFNNIVNAAK